MIHRGDTFFGSGHSRHSGLVDACLDGPRSAPARTRRKGKGLQRIRQSCTCANWSRRRSTRSFPNIASCRTRGSIEISTTPFYHPILPILIDSRVDDPTCRWMSSFPDDAREQLMRARNFMKDDSECILRGCGRRKVRCRMMWLRLSPSSGFRGWPRTKAFSRNPVSILMGQSRRSVRSLQRAATSPSFSATERLSDLIGFQYMHARRAKAPAT